MGRPNGMERSQAIIQTDVLDLDADTKGESAQTSPVEGTQFLAAHVVVAGPQVETFGDQEFRTEDEVAEEVVEEWEIVLNGLATEVKLDRGIPVKEDQVGTIDIVDQYAEAKRHVLQTLGDPDLNIERKRSGKLGVPLAEVKAHVLEDQSSREKAIVRGIEAAEVE